MADLRRGWFCDHAPGRGRIITAAGPVGLAGKYYFEIKCTTISNNNKICVGLANLSFNLTNPAQLDLGAGQYTGLDGGFFYSTNTTHSDTWAGDPNGPGQKFGNNAYVVNFHIGIAVDTSAGKAWAQSDLTGSSGWIGGNGVGTPDPVAGVQGYALSDTGLTGNVYILCGSGWENFGDAVHPTLTLNAGATAFALTKPTGYAAWDATGATTLNPADKDSYITLSGGNLAMTIGSPGSANQPTAFVRSTTSKTR